MAHVSAQKQNTVDEFGRLLTEYPIVGALNMEGLPARQLQVMREQLRGKCVIRMTKRRLMHVALDSADKKRAGIKELAPHLKGMPALLFTSENPFTLFKILKKNKSPAPAKGGQEAPADITIPAGPTPFAPGPIIGELGKFGLKTGVENGKVAVKEAKVVCKEGETISAELAGLLTRLQIFPMEVGLDLTAVFEEGNIIEKKVLDIDEDEYMNNLIAAAQGAVNLGVNAGVANSTTLPYMLSTAAREAVNLAVESAYLSKETTDLVLGRGSSHAAALASYLPEELVPEELKAAAAQAAAAPVTQAPAGDDDSKPAPEEKEEESDAAAGLGALFG